MNHNFFPTLPTLSKCFIIEGQSPCIWSSVYNAILTTGLVIILGRELYLGLWMISGWLNQIDERLLISLRSPLIAMVATSFIYSPSGQAVLQHFSLRLVLTSNF